MYKNTECKQCDGKGYRIVKGIGIYRFVRIECEPCKGTGLIRKILR